MTKEILIAGFGGQGVLSMGKMLAYAGMLEGKEVTWLPSYGPEQRGGTSNVTVVISDEKISSPVVDRYDIVVALNQQSVSKFESRVKEGGLLVYDTYGVTEAPERKDITRVGVAGTERANQERLGKTYNTLMLGALIGAEQIVGEETVIRCLRKTLPARYREMIGENERAIAMGMEMTATERDG